jgi:hypothetical protein
MTRFLVCSRSQELQPEGWTLCHSYTYGEYDNLDAALTRMKEVVKNAYKWKNEVIKYYVNELAPPNTYPVVAKSYPYEDV